MSPVQLLCQWLLEHDDKMVAVDNGEHSYAIGEKSPNGHQHWSGYIYESLDRPITYSVYSYHYGSSKLHLLVADPTSFEVIYGFLKAGPPALCFECKRK